MDMASKKTISCLIDILTSPFSKGGPRGIWSSQSLKIPPTPLFKRGAKSLFLILLMVLAFAQCTKPLLYGKVQQIKLTRRGYDQTYDKVFEAARWALTKNGYAIEDESKMKGTIETKWASQTPDSHYVEVFGRRDYGTVGAYYHLDLAVYQESGIIQVVVRNIAESTVNRLYSTGIQEKKVLDDISLHLLGKTLDITNLGLVKP